jgi:transcriptional regulator with XRE-family HTH domain
VHFGARLRACRREQKLSQAEAARFAGISRNTLVGLERAQFPNPNLRTLLSLMETYGLGSLEELFGTTPSRHLAMTWDRDPRANAPERGASRL